MQKLSYVMVNVSTSRIGLVNAITLPKSVLYNFDQAEPKKHYSDCCKPSDNRPQAD